MGPSPPKGYGSCQPSIKGRSQRGVGIESPYIFHPGLTIKIWERLYAAPFPNRLPLVLMALENVR